MVFGGLCTLLAAAGHAAAGGGLPDPAVLAGAGAVAGLAVSGSAHRPARLRVVFPALLTAQLLFHLLFSVAGRHSGGHAGTSSGGLGLWAMIGFHLVAALLSAAALTRAERAAAAVARGFRRLVLAGTRTPAPPERPGLGRLQRRERDSRRPVAAMVGAAAGWRGPPLTAH